MMLNNNYLLDKDFLKKLDDQQEREIYAKVILLTFDDYLDFLTHCFLLTSDDQFITDADDEFFDLKLTNDN